MTYQPRFQTQRSPSADPYARFDCAAFSMAMLIDRATHGGVVVTGGRVRALTNEPRPDPASPGLNLPQTVAVANRLHVAIAAAARDSWQGLINGLRAGRAYNVPLLYGKVPPALRGIPGFVGGHMIYVDRLECGEASVWVGDPLQHDFVKWPLDVLRAAWAAFGTGDAFSRPTS